MHIRHVPFSARFVLAALEGHGATPDSPAVITQYNIIKDILDHEHMNTYTWMQLLSGKGPSGVLRRMLLGAWMQAMNQISGINVTSYYMSYIFINALGISELLSRILAAAGSVDYLIFACLAYFVIERYGRRKVMMTSAAACSICWIVIAASQGQTEKGGDSYKLGIVAVAFFFVFFASFGMGVLGVPWLYPTEINALEMRTKGASLAMATNWICNYGVVQATLPGMSFLLHDNHILTHTQVYKISVTSSGSFGPSSAFPSSPLHTSCTPRRRTAPWKISIGSSKRSLVSLSIEIS
jgi:MFS family permease